MNEYSNLSHLALDLGQIEDAERGGGSQFFRGNIWRPLKFGYKPNIGGIKMSVWSTCDKAAEHYFRCLTPVRSEMKCVDAQFRT